MLLKLENISKGYSIGECNHQVLKSFTLEINPNDRIWISGRNGSGKTTLLRIISGDLAPDSGNRFLPNQNLRISLLSQSISNYIGKSLTVAEHISLGMSRKGILKKLVTNEAKLSIAKNLARLELGLENRLDDFVGNLSGGEAQIIGIFTVILTEPDLLCLDEPSASLDFRISEIIAKMLKEITTDRNTALVFVSHDKDFALGLRTKEVVL